MRQKDSNKNEVDFLRKKLHASSIRIKRALRQARENQKRSIIKELKTAQKSAEEKCQLEAMLKKIRLTSVNDLYEMLQKKECNNFILGGNIKRILKADIVLKQVSSQDEIKELLQQSIKRDDTLESFRDKTKSITEHEICIDEIIAQSDKGEPQMSFKEKRGIQRKKTKNRMGQRARKRLATRMHATGKDKCQGSSFNCKNIGGEIRSQTKMMTSKKGVESIHPSWIAKRKNADASKISLASPTGKKIVFEDD